jgi:hypothetical protein
MSRILAYTAQILSRILEITAHAALASHCYGASQDRVPKEFGVSLEIEPNIL